MSGVMKIEATKAKATFSKLPEKARSKDIEITKHGEPQGYYLAPDEYRRLKALDRTGKTTLESLEHQFRTMVQGMQTSAHRAAVRKIAKAPLTDIVRSAKSVDASSIFDLGGTGRFNSSGAKIPAIVKAKKRR